MKTEATMMFEDGDYRIVKGASYHIEKRDGADALGVPRWSPVDAVAVDDPRYGDSEPSSVEVPSELFRAVMRSLRSVKPHEETIARLRSELAAAEAKLRRYEGGSVAGMLDRD